MHKGDATLVAGSGEAGHIAYDSPAERHDRAITAKTIRDQNVQNPRDVRQYLVRLTVRQDDLNDSARPKGGRKSIQVKRRNRRITNDQHIARRDMLSQKIGPREQALADQNRIATTA